MVNTQQPTLKRRRGFLAGYTTGDIIFNIINYSLVTLLTIACLFPFLNTFAKAFSSKAAIEGMHVTIWPIGFQTAAIKYCLKDPALMRAFANTVLITVVGTAINMFMTIITAYPLSRKDFKGKGLYTNYMIITMFFGGGMIPAFILIKNLGLLNTYWALWLPGAMGSFNVIIMRTFFQGLPDELRESAVVDGCGNMRFIISIVLPLSTAVIATLSLFYAVGWWNTFMSALLYINKMEMWPLQVKLRNILLLEKMDTSMETINKEAEYTDLIKESLKSAIIVVSTVPILIVYPFLQKYFVKGVMVGSIKG